MDVPLTNFNFIETKKYSASETFESSGLTLKSWSRLSKWRSLIESVDWESGHLSLRPSSHFSFIFTFLVRANEHDWNTRFDKKTIMQRTFLPDPLHNTHVHTLTHTHTHTHTYTYIHTQPLSFLTRHLLALSLSLGTHAHPSMFIYTHTHTSRHSYPHTQ